MPGNALIRALASASLFSTATRITALRNLMTSSTTDNDNLSGGFFITQRPLAHWGTKRTAAPIGKCSTHPVAPAIRTISLESSR